MLPKQDIPFVFGAVDGSRYKRGLQAGDLVEAINCRQIIGDAYRKRPGYDRSVPSGSPTTPLESFLTDGKRLLTRDAADVVWALSDDLTTWQSRGTAERALPTVSSSINVPDARRPVAVDAGTDTWVFTKATNSYVITVFDEDGDVVIRGQTQTATGIVTRLAAVAAGANIWVFWYDATNIYTHKYVIANGATQLPTSATYVALANVKGFDAYTLASGTVAVAITTRNGNDADLRVGYLNAGNGTEAVSPAAVSTDIDGAVAGGTPLIEAPSILVGEADGNIAWYVVFWGPRSDTVTGASATQANLYRATITTSNLATAVGVISATDDTDPVKGWACGYRKTDGSGDLVIYSSTDSYTGTPAQPRPYRMIRYEQDGGTGAISSAHERYYSFPVSKPQQIGTDWYLVTGYDDGPAAGFSRSYFLVNDTMAIVCQVGYGQAAGAGLSTPAVGLALTEATAFVTPLIAAGNKLICATLLDTGGGATSDIYAPGLFIFDLAATYAAPTRVRDGVAAWPGGVPVQAGTGDHQHELALMLSPVNATFALGGGAALAGPTVVQYVYRIVDVDGTIYRSAPSPAQSVTFNSTTRQVIVKSLTHFLAGTTAAGLAKIQIEVYLSAVNGTQPYLHAVVDNAPGGPTVTVTVTPDAVSTAETLYTFGGGIDNAPLPHSRALAMWRNRVLVASGRELWPSLEMEVGLGPRFNENFVTEWSDGDGDILAVCPVDWNYCALFKRNAVGVISGGGPIPTVGGGVAGNYEVQTLRQQVDIVPRSVVSGPMGCYFQNDADKRIYCVTGQDVVDVSQGMEAYTSETVVATNHVFRDRQIHFHMDSGAIMVLDYAHPAQGQPAGRWLRWYTSGLLAACGAAINASGAPVHLETLSALRSQGSGFQDATASTPVDVLMKWTTGDLAAAGGIRGEFRIDAVTVDGEWIAANTSRLTVASDHAATSTTHTTPSLTAGPQELYARPAGHDRVKSVRLSYEETASSGEGFVMHGVTLTIQQRGRARVPNHNRRVA